MSIAWRVSLLGVALAGLPGIAGAADPVATDLAAGMGLKYGATLASKTQGESAVFDYDGDGNLDVLLSAHNQGPWPLLKGGATGKFTTANNVTFRKYDRHGCVAADFGSVGGAGLPDGRPDLYCAIGACEGTCTKEFPNELWLQRSDHTFVDTALAWGVTDGHGRGRDTLALDYDRDGRMDIVVLNAGSPSFDSSDRLYRNTGGRFVEIKDKVVNREVGSGCGSVGDFSGDGYPDLALCSGPSGVALYRNTGAGGFINVPTSAMRPAAKVHDVELADLDADGRPDLLIVSNSRLSIRLNVNGTFPKEDYGLALSAGHDVAAGDVDLDGSPDLYVVQGRNGPVRDLMLLNDGTGKGFRSIPVPQAKVGEGDVVTAIPDYAGSGRAAFIVTNGKNNGTPGPVQLFTFANQ